jgi:hypothetical protein
MSEVQIHQAPAGFEVYADDLLARFPYQFAGSVQGVIVFSGWAQTFRKLCEDVDAFLGQDKYGFRWLQVKEKFGTLNCYFTLDRAAQHETSPQEQRLIHGLREIVSTAEAQTYHLCAKCGMPGQVERSMGWLLALCDEHVQERRAHQKLALQESSTPMWSDSFWIPVTMPERIKHEAADSPYGRGAGLSSKTPVPRIKPTSFPGDERGKKE